MILGCVKKNWKFPTCYFRLVTCAIKFRAVKIRILGKDAVINTKIWFILLFNVSNFRLQPTQNRSMKSITVVWNVHKDSAKDLGYIRSLYLIAKLLFDKRHKALAQNFKSALHVRRGRNLVKQISSMLLKMWTRNINLSIWKCQLFYSAVLCKKSTK